MKVSIVCLHVCMCIIYIYAILFQNLLVWKSKIICTNDIKYTKILKWIYKNVKKFSYLESQPFFNIFGKIPYTVLITFVRNISNRSRVSTNARNREMLFV